MTPDPIVDPETIALLVNMQLNRFPRARGYSCYVIRGEVMLRIDQISPHPTPLADGHKFYLWLARTPDITWQQVVSAVTAKRRQLRRKSSTNQ